MKVLKRSTRLRKSIQKNTKGIMETRKEEGKSWKVDKEAGMKRQLDNHQAVTNAACVYSNNNAKPHINSLQYVSYM